MHSKKIIIGIVLICLFISLLGCSRRPKETEEDQTSIEIVEVEEEEQEEEISYEGLAINPLTGLWIDEEAAARRPVAVMINNIKAALPQSGLSQADIIYETLAEGTITRLVAVFQDFDAEKIGPIRSTRHYYLNFAFDHDAIFVHHGGSPQAFEAIRNLAPANLNSLSYLEEIMAWRDPVRSRNRAMYEHSLYTNAEGIMRAWQTVGYRTEPREDLVAKLKFTEEEWTPSGENAETVVVPFSKDYISTYRYDTEAKTYKRYQFNEAHIDENNNQQLEVKNLIIQYANIRVIPGDPEGRRDIELIGSGNGVYITNGKVMPITWSKSAHNNSTQYKDADGKPLKLNKGKTWISIFPNNREIELQ